MASYLDGNGLLYFWQKIKNTFVPSTRKVNNKALSTDISLTASDVGALPSSTTIPSPGTGSSYPVMDGTRSLGSQAGYARVDHVHPSDTTKVDKVSGKGLSTNDFTDTLKNKLDNIMPYADENQNAFSYVKVGSTTISADSEEDTLELVAGSNVTLTPDATNDKVTIAATDTTYSDATTSAHGLMSANDKTKLDGIDAGAVKIWRGSCGTHISTAEKAVTLDDSGFELKDGVLILVRFGQQNSASNITLNVNSTGAHRVYAYGSITNAPRLSIFNPMLFQYDGTLNYWLLVDSGVALKSAANATNSSATPSNTSSRQYAVTPDADGYLSVNVPWTMRTLASTAPSMDGTAAVGTSSNVARQDHVHPSDTSRVPTSRTVNGKALSANITLSASDVSAIPTSAKGAASGVCPLNSSSKIDATYLPSYVDDVIEAYPRSGQTELSSTWLATGAASGTVITPESGKIYVLMTATTNYPVNSQFRWGGSAYVLLQSGEGVSAITNAEIDTIVAS